MRNVLIGLASLLAATTVVHADPLAVSSHPTDTAAPTTYVQGGAMIGGNDGYVTIGGSGELGKLVAPHLWIHGSLTEGLAGQLFATGNGSILQVRAGADAMGCLGSGVLCAYVGADAGYQHTTYAGMTDPLFCGDNGCDREPIDESHDRMIGVGRVGLDIGGKNLRWRPGFEAAVSGDGVNGVNITQSIAYRF
jgi:hypothetical protein